MNTDDVRMIYRKTTVCKDKVGRDTTHVHKSKCYNAFSDDCTVTDRSYVKMGDNKINHDDILYMKKQVKYVPVPDKDGSKEDRFVKKVYKSAIVKHDGTVKVVKNYTNNSTCECCNKKDKTVHMVHDGFQYKYMCSTCEKYI